MRDADRASAARRAQVVQRRGRDDDEPDPPRASCDDPLRRVAEPVSMYAKLNLNQNHAAPTRPRANSHATAAAIGSAQPKRDRGEPRRRSSRLRCARDDHGDPVERQLDPRLVLEQDRGTDERTGRGPCAREERLDRADERQHHEQLAVRGERVGVDQRRREHDPEQRREIALRDSTTRGDPGEQHRGAPTRRGSAARGAAPCRRPGRRSPGTPR